MTLYELPSWYKRLESMVDQNGGEIGSDLGAELSAYEGTRDEKFTSVCQVVRQLQAEANEIRDEINRLQGHLVRRDRTVERLKNFLADVLAAEGVREWRGAFFSVWIQRNGQYSLTWTDQDRLPPQDLCKTVVTPDFARVRDMIDKGGHCPPGFVLTRGEHLRIK